MCASGELTDGRWTLAGDSAGGGLALATVRTLRANGCPLPAGLLLTAPCVDLAMTNPDLDASEPTDPFLRRGWLLWAGRLYAAGTPLEDPALSPINGSFAGFPPVHLNVGTRDLFLPDVRRLRDALQRAGVPVGYVEQQGALHTYPHEVTRRRLGGRSPPRANGLTGSGELARALGSPSVLPRSGGSAEGVRRRAVAYVLTVTAGGCATQFRLFAVEVLPA